MSCSHVLILNRHVFLNTRKRNIHRNGFLCGTDIKLGRYCNMESRRAVLGLQPAISLRVRDLLGTKYSREENVTHITVKVANCTE